MVLAQWLLKSRDMEERIRLSFDIRVNNLLNCLLTYDESQNILHLLDSTEGRQSYSLELIIFGMNYLIQVEKGCIQYDCITWMTGRLHARNASERYFHCMFTLLSMWTKLRHQDCRNISPLKCMKTLRAGAPEVLPSGALTCLNWSFCWMVPLRLLTQSPEPVSIFFPAPQSLYKHQTLCTPICILTAWDLLSL